MKFALMSIVLGAALATAYGVASAQSANRSKTNSAGTVTADQIVKRYISSARAVMQANSAMLDAVGLKTEASQAAVQASKLTDSASREVMESSSKVQLENSKALEAKLGNASTTLDVAGKKKFAAGLAELAKGVVAHAGLANEIDNLKPGVGSLKGSTSSTLFVAKSLPESTMKLVQTLKLAINFCKTRGIPVPKEASDLTGMI